MRLNLSNNLKVSENTPIEIIKEDSEQILQFNVMPNKKVNEKLIINKYIVKKNKIEAFFDRKYETDMLKSPDHFIFLSALINLQKMIYVLMCRHLNIEYSSSEPEKLKIWPLKTDIDMNGMIRKKKNVKQDFEVQSIEKLAENKYILKGVSTSESTIKISGSALVYKI
tara:strand:+ start:204 stop:707 length:504 start_codon:yes stop_codon:yes gene_type:complete